MSLSRTTGVALTVFHSPAEASMKDCSHQSSKHSSSCPDPGRWSVTIPLCALILIGHHKSVTQDMSEQGTSNRNRTERNSSGTDDGNDDVLIKACHQKM